MAWFTAKEWKNRLVEFAGRRSLKNVSTNETTVYDVTRNEGQVSQEGDSFSATTMNDLEQRISDAFAEAEEANTQLTSERLKFISSTRVVVSRSSINSGQRVENISVSYEVPEGTKLIIPVFGGCNWGNIVSSQFENLLSGSFNVSAINLSPENHTLVIVFNIYFFG